MGLKQEAVIEVPHDELELTLAEQVEINRQRQFQFELGDGDGKVVDPSQKEPTKKSNK